MSSPLIVEGEAARQLIARMDDFVQPPQQGRGVRAIKMTQPFVVVQDADDAPIRGRLTCDAGCYLVQTAEGNLYPVPGPLFERQYTRRD